MKQLFYRISIAEIFSQLLLLILPVYATANTTIQQPHIQAELIFEHVGVTPGVEETFALKLRPDPKWHVYWKYAGDSGAPPVLHWEINGQSVDAEVLWPTPERIAIGTLMNYGYHEVLLMSDLPIPTDVEDSITVRLDAEWLVCEEECIPGRGTFELHLPAFRTSLPDRSPHYEEFAKFRNRLPTDGSTLGITLRETSDSTFILSLPTPSSPIQSISFFPDHQGVIDNSASQTSLLDEKGMHLSLTKSQPINHSLPFSGIVVQSPPFPDGSNAKAISLPFPKPMAQHGNSTSFILVLLAAFLGGLILNLMPCVFPVLSIKVLGFVNKAGKDPTSVRNHGLAFAGGILLSFWGMALIIRAFREAGEKLGWGFQLQNPIFVSLLILLLLAVALNLFGVFEFGGNIQRVCGSLDTDGETYGNSFFSGVLATLLATPCTAPFMGGAIAYGIQSSLGASLAVFSILALGLSTPYLILSFFPKLLTVLPKPGQWMETFKELMGFPVLLTALWLLWVFDKQSSSRQLLALLLSMILLAFGLWIYGKVSPPCAPQRKQVLGLGVCFITLLACIWIGVPLKGEIASASEDSVHHAPQNSEKDAYGQEWFTFSPELVEQLLDENRPVYVDFTAAWCITCQVNERLVFGSEAVRKEIKRKGLVLVKGDWTNEDPVITEELEKFDRLGVPLNVIYNPKDPENPIILPSVLTPQIILEQIKAL